MTIWLLFAIPALAVIGIFGAFVWPLLHARWRWHAAQLGVQREIRNMVDRRLRDARSTDLRSNSQEHP